MGRIPNQRPSENQFEKTDERGDKRIQGSVIASYDNYQLSKSSNGEEERKN